MQAYIINLDDRKDRWLSVERQFSSSHFNFQRVSAIQDAAVFDDTRCTLGVTAIWLSHKKAMERFLASSDQYALILEDDFNVKSWDKMKIIIQKSLLYKFDFVQIGYLKTSPLNSISILTQNSQDFFLKWLALASEIPLLKRRKFFSRLLIREQTGIPMDFVLNDIRAGAHCYLINRKFAEFALGINAPIFLSTDLLYMSLGHMRSLNMSRVRKSVVSQSKSPSSVTERFLRSN
jgi:GR25 family glycosyltransferase involved in LPS biosynthesis